MPDDRRMSVISASSVTNLGIINVAQHQANLRKEESEKRKNKLREALPEPKQGVTGWTTAGFKECLKEGCPAGMEAAIPPEYVFMSRAGMEFESVFNIDLQNKYELMDVDGKRLFFAAETLEEWNDYPNKTRMIDATIFGRHGGSLCSVMGSEAKGYTVKSDFDDFGSFKMSEKGVYVVKDSGGLGVLNISMVKARSGLDEFKITDFTTNALLGLIKQSWAGEKYGDESDNEETEGKEKEEESRVHVILPDNMGVQFDKNMTPLNKSLLICFMMTLYFKYKEPVNYGENKRSFVIGVLYNLVVGLIIFIMIAIVIIFSVFIGNDDKDKGNTTTTTTTTTTATK